MTAIEKFTFALNFDDADNVIRSAGNEDEHYELKYKKKKKKKPEEEAPPPPPAIYTEEQAAAMVAEAEARAREQAHAEGHAQGLEQGRQEILTSLEKALADTETRIANTIAQLDEQQKRANARINEDAIHVATGIVRKLLPAWSKQSDLIEIEDIVRKCLGNLFDVHKILIRVHPDLEHPLTERAQKIAESRGFSGKVVVVGEPEIAPGNCTLSWGDGTVVRDSGQVWSEINQIIDNALTLHAGTYGLTPSDMGDPDIQQTRHAPQASPPSHHGSSSTDTQPAAPITAQDASGSAAVSQAQPDASPSAEIEHPDVALHRTPPMGDSPSQEVDGTTHPNVTPSPEDEIKQHSAPHSDAISPPETIPAPDPSDAAPTGALAPENVTGAEDENDDRAKVTKVTQTTKDAGDENG